MSEMAPTSNSPLPSPQKSVSTTPAFSAIELGEMAVRISIASKLAETVGVPLNKMWLEVKKAIPAKSRVEGYDILKLRLPPCFLSGT